MKKRFLIYILVLIVDIIIFGGGAYWVFHAKDIVPLYYYRNDLRDWNKECPRQLNELFILECIKFEDEALVYKISSREGVVAFCGDELRELFKYTGIENSLPYKEYGKIRPDSLIDIDGCRFHKNEDCRWFDEKTGWTSVSPKVAAYFIEKQIEKEKRKLPIKIGGGLTMVSYRLGKENTIITDIDVDESVFDMNVLEVYGKEMSRKLREDPSIQELINDKKFANPHIVYHIVGKNSGREYDLEIN